MTEIKDCIKDFDICPPKEFSDFIFLIKAAEEWINNGDYFDTWYYDSKLHKDFWHHYEIYTGKKVDESKKQNFFVCHC